MQLHSASLELDVLAYAPACMSLSECAQLIKLGMRRQLGAMQASMATQGNVQDHCACHFQPPGWLVCISVVQPFARISGEVCSCTFELADCVMRLLEWLRAHH